jgi:hypothetical protein
LLRKLTVIAISMLFMLGGTTAAQAHIIGKPPKNVKALHAWQVKNLKHVRYVCARGSGKPKRWACGSIKWLKREASETAEPTLPPHYSQWLCIHHYEGAWNDPNAPYYGGLQFADSTWRRNGGLRYAPYAHYATPLQQMWIAESAWRESGGSFSQWPNTARWCGLL